MNIYVQARPPGRSSSINPGPGAAVESGGRPGGGGVVLVTD